MSESARRARVGDMLLVACIDVDGQPVTTVVTAAEVTRLFCGCDEILTARPGGRLPQHRMVLLPAGCYHNPADCDDYDQARAAAVSSVGGEQT